MFEQKYLVLIACTEILVIKLEDVSELADKMIPQIQMKGGTERPRVEQRENVQVEE